MTSTIQEMLAQADFERRMEKLVLEGRVEELEKEVEALKGELEALWAETRKRDAAPAEAPVVEKVTRKKKQKEAPSDAR